MGQEKREYWMHRNIASLYHTLFSDNHEGRNSLLIFKSYILIEENNVQVLN
jgi:hypothetical protein